jgi:hypothetical protein
MKLEVIYWRDHWGRSDGGWKCLDEIPEPQASLMKSVGWVIKENKDCVLVSPDVDEGIHDNYVKSNHEQCILKSCIVSRHAVTVTKRTKKK